MHMISGPPLILEELMSREILQFLCALIVDSYGDNAETNNPSVTNNLSQSKRKTTEAIPYTVETGWMSIAYGVF